MTAPTRAQRRQVKRLATTARAFFSKLGVDTSPLSDAEAVIGVDVLNKVASMVSTQAHTYLLLHMELVREYGIRHFIALLQSYERNPETYRAAVQTWELEQRAKGMQTEAERE